MRSTTTIAEKESIPKKIVMDIVGGRLKDD